MSHLVRPTCALLLTLTLVPVARPAAPPGHLDRHGDPLPRGATARLGSVRYRLGYGEVPLALSPDGKRVFVTSHQGTLGVFDVAAGTTRQLKLPNLDNDIQQQQAVVAPRGDSVLVHSGTELLSVDLGTGKKRWGIKAALANNLPAFDPAGKHFARFSPKENQPGEGTVSVHRADTGRQTASVAVKGQDIRFAVSPGGTRLLTWDTQAADNMNGRPGWQVVFWDADKGKEVAKATFRTGFPLAAFRPDGKEVAVAAGGTVALLDPATAKQSRALRAAGQVSSISYSPDGKHLAAVSHRRADLWETKTWKRLPTRAFPDFDALAMAFPGPGRFLVAGARGRELILADLLTGKTARSPAGHAGSVTSLFFDGSQVHSAGNDGQVITWDLSGRQRRQVTVTTGIDQFDLPLPNVMPLPRAFPIAPPSDLAGGRLEFSPSGRWVVGDYGIVYDRRAGEMRFDSLNDPSVVDLVRIARDREILFAAGQDDEDPNGMGVKLSALRLDNGEQLWSVTVKAQSVGRLAVTPDGKMVALMVVTGEGQFAVRLFDGATGKTLGGSREHEKAGSPGQFLEFTGDGRMLVGAADQGGLFVLDARSGELLHGIPLEGRISNAALSPRGRMAAVALWKDENDTDPTIHVLEFTSGKARLTFAPKDLVGALAFSPDGKYLASGHDDGTAVLWDLEPPRSTGGVTSGSACPAATPRTPTAPRGNCGAIRAAPSRCCVNTSSRPRPARPPPRSSVSSPRWTTRSSRPGPPPNRRCASTAVPSSRRCARRSRGGRRWR